MAKKEKKEDFEIYGGMLKNEGELEEELDEIGKDSNEVVESYFTDPEEEFLEIDIEDEED
ncbi:MAG: hypothetical protein ACOC1P_03040 [Minisyncoccales bacterium]